MAELQDRVKYALDEARTLILVAEVLLGFEFQSILQKGFESLSPFTQYLKLGSLCLMLVALVLLMAPAAYHRIVEHGNDTRALNRFATFVIGLGLLPFAAAFGVDVYVAVGRVLGEAAAIAAASVAALVALSFWYGLEFIARATWPRTRSKRAQMTDSDGDKERAGTPLKDRVSQLLTEIRVVVPGAQALLGFQFATVFIEGFDKLPASSKYVHLVSLGFVGLATILLMAPAAYHRIVEQGEETEHFCRIANRMLLGAMVVLALGICLDLYVVARKVTGSQTAATVIAVLALLVFYGLWFGLMLVIRARRRYARPPAAAVHGGTAL